MICLWANLNHPVNRPIRLKEAKRYSTPKTPNLIPKSHSLSPMTPPFRPAPIPNQASHHLKTTPFTDLAPIESP